jgi:hypothetical protein
MTRFIEGPARDKANYLTVFGGQVINQPASYDLGIGRTLVCVVDNGAAETAAVIENEHDWQAASDPMDARYRTFVSVPTKTVAEMLLAF